MTESITSGSVTESSRQENVLWLRTNALNRLIITGVVIGIVWFAYLGVVVESTDYRTWIGSVTLALSSLLAARSSSRWGFGGAVLVYVIGVILTIVLAAWTYGEPMLLLLMAVPVGIASLLIGPGMGFAVAAGISVVLAAGNSVSPVLEISPTIVGLTAVFVFLNALLLWIATYPLRMTMHWALDGYEQARQQTAQAREHRAELMNLAKELEMANHRLKSMAFELDRARQAANEARRLKAEFAANISHELRTPLNLIIGFSEMMAMASHVYGVPLPAAYRGDVQAIYRNARHLSNLIDDVLDLSQIEAGRMGLVKKPTDLAEIVVEAAATVSALFENKKLTLVTEVADDLPLVEVDRTRIRQVLINLLNNAAHFTDQGQVTVTASVDERDVNVSVADSGVGISAEDLPKVFEEFRQLDGSVQQRRKGSGLGLAISKKFVELHGGRMWVESESGLGTTFHFRLPLLSSLVPGRTPPKWETWVRLTPNQNEKKAIVVLNEDAATVRLFERYLDGYQIDWAADRQAMQAMAARQAIQAILVVVPSGEDGWIKLRHVREELPNVPVLVCTLRGGAQKLAQAPGVATYLVKPVSQERFLSALERLGPHIHRLLLVDDEPEVVRLLGRMVRLAPQRYQVLKAYNGAQALDILQAQQPDAVVLDLLMPELDGYAVIERMQADPRLRDIPIIVVSAKGLEDEVITAGLVGATRRDGFSIGEMMRCLKANLEALRPPALIYTEPEHPTASAG